MARQYLTSKQRLQPFLPASLKRGENIPFSFHFFISGPQRWREKKSRLSTPVCCVSPVKFAGASRFANTCERFGSFPASCRSCVPVRPDGRTDGRRRSPDLSLSLSGLSFRRSPSLSVTRLVVTELGGWWPASVPGDFPESSCQGSVFLQGGGRFSLT